jgi:MFS family permease
MDNPSGAWLGFINGIYWLGNLCMVPLAAPIANKFGRKSCIYIGYVFLIPGVILQSAAHNSIAFVMARLLLGATSGWFSVGVPLLLTEISYPTQRAIVSSIYNTGWYVGAIIAAFVTYGTRNMGDSWSWRIPSLLQILMPLVAFPGLLLIPESPRWNIAVGRTQAARDTLTKYHTGGDSQAPLLTYEMFEIENTIAAEKASSESASYIDMVRTKGNRWRLAITMSLAIFSQWSGNGVVSYYLALVLETVGITKTSDQLMISAGWSPSFPPHCLH